HAKLLAPIWTAGCELPLLFPKMKVVAPRLVTHYFANSGNPEEGSLRNQAAAFIGGERLGSPARVKALELKVRQVVESDRADGVAALCRSRMILLPSRGLTTRLTRDNQMPAHPRRNRAV